MRLVDIDLIFAEMDELKNQDILPDYSSLSFREKARLAQYTQVIREKLNALPMVEGKPVVHGQWIVVRSEMTGMLVCMCSNCGKLKSIFLDWDYCPGCGADMRPENNRGIPTPVCEPARNGR